MAGIPGIRAIQFSVAQPIEIIIKELITAMSRNNNLDLNIKFIVFLDNLKVLEGFRLVLYKKVLGRSSAGHL